MYFWRWPFDWRAPFGYLVAWRAQIVGFFALVVSASPFFHIFFGSCWLLNVIVQDLTNDMAAFNNTDEIQNDNNRVKLMKVFCKIIQDYSEAKQFVNCYFSYICFGFIILHWWIFAFISTGWFTLPMKCANIRCLHIFRGIWWLCQV